MDNRTKRAELILQRNKVQRMAYLMLRQGEICHATQDMRQAHQLTVEIAKLDVAIFNDHVAQGL